MPKGGKFRSALDELREFAASKAPQKGFFSTLDELIQQAPFEKAPVEQWRSYLQPGRMLKRGDTQFPLKGEELKYALDPILQDVTPDLVLQKKHLLGALRERRPQFKLNIAGHNYVDPRNPGQRLSGGIPETRMEQLQGPKVQGPRDTYTGTVGRNDTVQPKATKYGPGERFERLSHESPGSIYEESVTRYPGASMGTDWGQHFAPDTLSHSRVSSHRLPSGEKMRLIEEIQSDLHEKAAERDRSTGELMEYMTPEERAEYESLDDPTDARHADRQIELLNVAKARSPRRGYITPEERKELDRLTNMYNGPAQEKMTDAQKERLIELESRRHNPTDVPFKDPAEYATLEMKKQLLDAVNNNEDYLALTRSQDQLERYGMDEESDYDPSGMQYIYDTVYPSAMKKLAKRYGLKMTEVEAPVGSKMDLRPDTIRHAGAEDIHEFLDYLGDADGSSQSLTLMKALPDEILTQGYPREKALRAMSLADETIKHYDLLDQLDRGTGANWNLPADQHNAEVNRLRNEIIKNFSEYADIVRDMYPKYEHAALLENPEAVREATKTFPAIKLTPEDRERIKKIGVPLWTVGAGAVGLDMLNQDQPAEAEEKPGMAKGGKVVPLRGNLDSLVQRWHALKRAHSDAKVFNAAGVMPDDQLKEIKDELDRLDALINRQPPDTGMAEGGSVDQHLDDLLGAIRSSQAEQATHRAPAEYRDPQLGNRFWTSLMTQWQGLDDDTGDVASMVDLTPTERNLKYPEPAFRRHPGADPLITATGKFHEPVISLGLRTLPEQLESTFHGDFLGENASPELQRLNKIEEQVQQRQGLDAPQGLAENLASTAGVLAGQLPLPGDMISSAVSKLPTAARVALKAPAAVADFFGPTFHPSISNLASGSAAGVGIQDAMEAWLNHKLAEKDAKWAPLQKSVDYYHADLFRRAREGNISRQEAEYLLKLLDAEDSGEDILGEPDPNEVPPVTMKKAKGGKVKSLSQARFQKKGLTAIHPDNEFILSEEHLGEGLTGHPLTKDIGKRVRFTDPEELRFPGNRGLFTIVGVQRHWGHDEHGNYVPNRIGYRVVSDQDQRGYGRPAPLDKVEIVSDDAVDPIDPGYLELTRRLGSITEDTPAAESEELLRQLEQYIKPPQKKAKGGKIKPPPMTKLGLRQKIQELMSDANVEGTGKEMVPLPDVQGETPAATNLSEPQSEPLTIEKLRELAGTPAPEKPSILETPVSRRDVLKGARDVAISMASPVRLDPLSMMSEAVPELASKAVAPAKAAMKARLFTTPQLAAVLQHITDNVFEGSEDSAEILTTLAKESAEAPQLARVAPLLAKVADLETRMANDKLDWESDEYMQGWETNRKKINDELGAIAQEHGVVRLPEMYEDFGDVESGPRTPTMTRGPRFVEPPISNMRGDVQSLIDDIRSGKVKPEAPGQAEALQKWLNAMGEQTDLAFGSRFLPDLVDSEAGKWWNDKTLKKFGIDESTLDYLDDLYEPWSEHHEKLDKWAEVDPEVRNEYRQVMEELQRTPWRKGTETRAAGPADETSNIRWEALQRRRNELLDQMYNEPIDSDYLQTLKTGPGWEMLPKSLQRKILAMEKKTKENPGQFGGYLEELLDEAHDLLGGEEDLN